MFLLAVLFIFASASSASAADGSIACAVIGADLTEEQILLVYQTFGFPRGTVTELRMTNELERTYLESFIDSSVIGTRSVSCVYVEKLPAGSGVQVTTSGNISYFTPDMYASALSTAGITDLRILVDAPFEVSGSGALAGIYYAYETLTGLSLNQQVKSVSGQELEVTGGLADEIGSADATDLVSDIKDGLGFIEEITDDQLRTMIQDTAKQYNIALTQSQTEQLISLCRSFRSLDEAGLLDKVQTVQGTIDKVSSFAAGVANFFNGVVSFFQTVSEFFGKMKALFA